MNKKFCGRTPAPELKEFSIKVDGSRLLPLQGENVMAMLSYASKP